MLFLIVDDDPTNLRLLRAALESESHAVVEAANGIEAFEVLGKHPIEVIISDILMPGMDGFRFCHELRRSGAHHSNLPLLLYSATYGSQQDQQLAKTVGADAFLRKPAPIATILQTIAQIGQKGSVRPIPDASGIHEHEVLEQYSAALVRKLELRNTELQTALGKLQAAHQEILELNLTLEQRVAQRTAGLDAAYKELETFSFSVSHDLRAPLRRVAGFAELIEQQGAAKLDPENRSFLGHIIRATREMDRLIDALLDLARTGRKELTLSDVDLEGVFEEALSTIYPETKGRSIKWVRTRLPTVRADPVLIKQVFVNLLSNAIKYTRTRDVATIEIGTHRGRGNDVVIFVRDNGVGFDVRHAAQLFGAFQRLHPVEQFEGVGIGLANAYRIVTRHGGAIWAEGAVGVGAAFFFSLPRAQPTRSGLEEYGQNTGRR
jgi:signal transduction histidine kinase